MNWMKIRSRAWTPQRVRAELSTLNPFVTSYRSTRVCMLLATMELLLAYQTWRVSGAESVVLVVTLVLLAGMDLGAASERRDRRKRDQLEYAIWQAEWVTGQAARGWGPGVR